MGADEAEISNPHSIHGRWQSHHNKRDLLGKAKAEPVDVVPDVGVAVVPERHSTAPCGVAPATAAQHTVRAT